MAAEIAVAIESEGEVADIAAALESDVDITPGDRERLAIAESVDDEALRTGVEQSIAVEQSLGFEVGGVVPADEHAAAIARLLSRMSDVAERCPWGDALASSSPQLVRASLLALRGGGDAAGAASHATRG